MFSYGANGQQQSTYSPQKNELAIASSNHIPSGIPSNVKQKMDQQNYDKQMNIKFAKVMVSMIGVPYVSGGDSKEGIDCSGLIIFGLAKLGYDVPDMTAADIANKADWLTLFNSTNEMFEGDLGILNFYNTDSDKGASVITHVNFGIGNLNSPLVFSQKNRDIPQIIDATENSWLVDHRLGNLGQMISPGISQVNQTYRKFSSTSPLIRQGVINWNTLNNKYKREVN